MIPKFRGFHIFGGFSSIYSRETYTFFNGFELSIKNYLETLIFYRFGQTIGKMSVLFKNCRNGKNEPIDKILWRKLIFSHQNKIHFEKKITFLSPTIKWKLNLPTKFIVKQRWFKQIPFFAKIASLPDAGLKKPPKTGLYKN